MGLRNQLLIINKQHGSVRCLKLEIQAKVSFEFVIVSRVSAREPQYWKAHYWLGNTIHVFVNNNIEIATKREIVC